MSLTFDRNRFGQHFITENGVQVFMLTVTRHGHAAGKECNVPHIGEENGESRVRAEDPNGRKRTDDTDPEGNHVR
jgi:hypothetical protein